MALVGKAAGGGRLGQAGAAAYQAARALGALLQQPGVGREAKGFFKMPQQLEAAQARHACHLGQGGWREQVGGDALAHLVDVRANGRDSRDRFGGTLSGQGVALREQFTDARQRLFAGECIDAGTAAAPLLQAQQQLLQRQPEPRILGDGAGQLQRGRILHAHRGGHGGGLQVQHAPAPRRPAQRLAVMHLAGVAHQDVTGISLNLAAAAGRCLRALLQPAHTKDGMRMAAVVARAVDVRAIHAVPGRGQDAALVRGRGGHEGDDATGQAGAPCLARPRLQCRWSCSSAPCQSSTW